MSLTNTPWCRSGMNCGTCRRSGPIRDNILAKWPDLECPLGIPLDPEEWPYERIRKRQEEFTPNKGVRGRCKYAEVGRRLAFNNRPCRGKIVTCKRDGACTIVYEAFCTTENCRFFKPEKEGKGSV